MKCLLNGNDVNINKQDALKRTALMWAQIEDHSEEIDVYDKISTLLIEAGAKLGQHKHIYLHTFYLQTHIRRYTTTFTHIHLYTYNNNNNNNNHIPFC